MSGSGRSQIAYIAFSDRGMRLASRLAEELGGTAVRGGRDILLDAWTRQQFAEAGSLVFVGAVGIAVRAISPYVHSKLTDPAVVVVDECGRYAIPVLSGHLGGANALAVRIAATCGAEAVLTTATDRNRVFAVDEWARRQGCGILHPDRIKKISAALLAGGTISVCSDWEIAGACPAGVRMAETEFHGLRAAESENRDFRGAEAESIGTQKREAQLCDVLVTVRMQGCLSGSALERHAVSKGAPQHISDSPIEEACENAPMKKPLIVVPRILCLGIGCRRGTPPETIEQVFSSFMEQNGYLPEAVSRVCSIDLKADEPGLCTFCKVHGLPFETWTAEELNALPGDFTSSEYVRQVTGTDNVCERSARMGCGENGILLCRKYAENGVTMALAAMDFRPDWRWTDG